MKTKRIVLFRHLFQLKLLDRYLLRELIGPFVVGLLVFPIIWIGAFVLYPLIDLIINKGVPGGAVLMLLIYRLPWAMVLGYPVGILFAVALVLSRMSRDSEIVGMRAGGVSTHRIMRPILVISLVMGFVSYLTNERIAPWTNHRAENIIRQVMLQQTVPLIEENKFFSASGNYWFYVKRVDVKTDTLYDVMIYEIQPQSYPRVIVAKLGTHQAGVWTLHDGFIHEFDNNGHLTYEAPFDQMKINLTDSIENFWREQRSPFEMGADELNKQIQVFQRGGIEVRSMVVLYHLKFAIPLACLILSLIAGPFSLRYGRSGSYIGLLMAILILFVYNGTLSWAQSLGNGGKMNPILAAWAANIVFGSIGVLMYVREP